METDNVDTVQSSEELERLVAALNVHSLSRRKIAQVKLRAGAESLARELLDLRKQNAQAREALEAACEFLCVEYATKQRCSDNQHGLCRALAAMKGGRGG